MLRRSAAAFVVLALGAIGCGDDPEPTPQGSLTIQIVSASDKPVGTQCPSIGHTANIGVPPPTTTTPGQLIDIGGCKVTGDGAFNGKIAQGQISFTMIGNVVGGSGTGLLVYYDNAVAATMESPQDNPCTITTEKAGTSLQIAKGRIWGEFTCPQIIAKPSAYCGANGVFVMQNCSD